ncbi:MATE family efflux transporter [uncultured Desulfobacter sp.]|uniref:MATE family efflux transporter n=1 Tax=uncultured Desulfobacter sp. TaxID=240139 RepID=UPI0029F480B5|nr:MATE family efflux transporter [uncultured Desulfobacter sp.]
MHVTDPSEVIVPKTFLRLLFSLALPISLQIFLTSSMAVIDMLMIGRLHDAAVAAVGIANQFVFIFFVIQFGVHSGVAIFTAQYWGKKDLSRIHQLSGLGILVGFVIGFVFAGAALCFPGTVIALFSSDADVVRLGAEYLGIVGVTFIPFCITFSFMTNMRSMGFAGVPLLSSFVAVVVNIVLNYCLIFGNFGFPAMGVKGAAIGTCTAKLLETGLLTAIIYLKPYPLAAPIKKMFSFDFAFVKRVTATCWPVFLNEFFWVTGVSIYKLVYARMGTEAIAAANIVATLEEFLFVPFFGIFHAGSILIGNSIGAKRYERAFAYGKFMLLTQLPMALGAGLVLILCRHFILGLYNISTAAYDNAYYLMLTTGLIFWTKTTNFTTIVSVFRGGGDTKFGFLIDLSGVWCIGVPMAFFGAFVFHWPVYGVMALIALEEMFKLIVGLPRFFSKKWIRNLVADPQISPENNP